MIKMVKLGPSPGSKLPLKSQTKMAWIFLSQEKHLFFVVARIKSTITIVVFPKK